METFITLGKVAGALVSIGGAVRYIPKWYRWFRSWKIIKQQEFERLKTIEAGQQKRETEKESLSVMDNHMEREIRGPSEHQDQEYMWGGFLWLLKEGFWLNCQDLAESAAGDSFLETAIHGPLCPGCKRDLGSVIRAGKDMCPCSKKFDLRDVRNDHFPIEELRRSAYAEAQAAVRRNELKQGVS